MTPLGTSKHLAARMGRWSASHWKTATFGWLAFVVASLAIGTVVGTKHIDVAKAGPGESGHVSSVLADEYKQSAGESVLVQSKTATVGTPAFKAAIDATVVTVGSSKHVWDIRSPLVAGNEGQISDDRHSALVQFKLKGTDLEISDKNVVSVVASVDALNGTQPGFTFGQFGDASVDQAINAQVGKDFVTAGVFSVPVTLLVLLFAFGALLAAGIPVLLALTAVAATTGLLAIPSQFLPIDKDAGVIVLLIGLAVGVDYSMFYLKREREERRAGRSERAAL
jgi:RND superfamily putative drug exporter